MNRLQSRLDHIRDSRRYRSSRRNAPRAFTARFYGYKYTYATLAALGLSVLRRAEPERFALDYVAMLEATGSGTPAQLPARCGLDADNPDVWEQSLSELERLCDLAW